MITEETISRVKSSLQATKSFLALEVIETLEKENAELKEQNKDLCESLDIMNNRESELLEQIEKMKLENADLKNFLKNNIVQNTDIFLQGLSD